MTPTKRSPFKGTIKKKLDNGWYLVEHKKKFYEYQSCPSVELEPGEPVIFIVIDEGVCEVIG